MLLRNYFVIDKRIDLVENYDKAKVDNFKGWCIHQGKQHTKESKRKNSESHKGRSAWNKGLKTGPLSEETRKKMSKALKNKPAWNKTIPTQEMLDDLYLGPVKWCRKYHFVDTGVYRRIKKEYLYYRLIPNSNS